MPRHPLLNHRSRNRSWMFVLGLLLSVLAWPAFALGLGQIEVKSQAGQPLLAEIPIISADPSELENLQARLASPDTFRRIGLEPPTGLVSGLHFAIALDAGGRPVIRITSDAPVQQPMLTFLVEVDWGQGRLVREYSALVDTPQTVAAPAQPPIQAPVVAPSNVIERPAESAVAPEPTVEAAPEAVAAEQDPQPEAAPPVPDAAPPPAPVPAPAPPAAVAAAPAGEIGPVQAGQTLGEIAATLTAGGGQSLNQVMLGLLRANPEAFIGGNLNLIRQGAVLRVPAQGDWPAESVAEANAIVREHVGRWREMRRPVPQPEAVADAPATDAPVATREAASTSPGAARTAQARLEIVPPTSGSGQQAGTRTGNAAGGEGDMLQQQELVQTRETLAARDAEVQDLKARVAELEQLRQQQQQLIQMKDSELAAAQQRLADSNAQPASTQAQAGTPPEAPAQATSGLPWVWIGLALLALAFLAWWLLSRRKASAQARKPNYGFASASSEPASPAPASAKPAGKPVVADQPASSKVAEAPAKAEPEPVAAPAPAPVVGADAIPGWQVPTAVAGTAPTWHAGGDDAARAASVAPLNPAPAGQERIELARAYVDLGDVETARSLLQEVADSGDAGARAEALQLLRELA